MIIVLLLFFQSICLYCQRLVLHIHDRWINPKNVRLLTEAAETTGNRKNQTNFDSEKRVKKRSNFASQEQEAGGIFAESCQFCANSPQGYCRHHFHLQELQVQKTQQKSKHWPLTSSASSSLDTKHDYRQLRRINRELKRNLKNRLNAQQQYQTKAYKPYTKQHNPIIFEKNSSTTALLSPQCSSNSSGYISQNDDSIQDLTESIETTDSGFIGTDATSSSTTYYFQKPAMQSPVTDHFNSNSSLSTP